MAEFRKGHARDFSRRLRALISQYNRSMTQTSGVLMIGPLRGGDFGADHVPDFTKAKAFLKEHKPSLIVFGHQSGENTDDFCKHLLEHSPQTLWIMSCEGMKPSQLVHWTNFGRVHELIEDFSDPTLEEKLRSGIEAAGTENQQNQLVEMFGEQSQQLQRLTGDLEARVQKRHRTLRKSLKTLEVTKTRLESFHGALLGIHRASTILQMEQSLNEALGKTLGLSWVRVRFASQSSLSGNAGPNVLAIEIPLHEEKLRGEILFAKSEGQRFTPSEVDFLHELSEALGLALARMHKLEQAEVLKGQWQATFDSIPHALCLTTSDFEILKMNMAFQQACTSHSFHSLLGKNCFNVFFGKDFQPPHNMASPFSFRNSRSGENGMEQFEVMGETLGIAMDNQPVQLVLIRSITEEARYERRILDASKLAELGTIGSSIAHELNNPLGGMLSFLQLILMDLKKGAPYHSEIKEMEGAVLRCRDIVQNLLSFARKQDLGEFSKVDLWEVAERAMRLIELQSKSMGVAIEFQRKSPAWVMGSVNGLSQAACNLMQNSLDAIAEKIKTDPLFPGKIRIKISKSKGQYLLSVSDNGTGIRPENQSRVFNPMFTTREANGNRGMGLTTAFTIVSDHRGTLEVLSQTGSATEAIVSIPVL